MCVRKREVGIQGRKKWKKKEEMGASLYTGKIKGCMAMCPA